MITRSRFLLVIAGCLLASAAFAADAPQPPRPDARLCHAVVAHTPSADVEYKPDTDVHGQPVVPANVDGGAPSVLPSTITIPLTVNLAKALNFDTSAYPYNQLGTGTEANIGTLSIEGNNVTLNGKPLNANQQSELAALCARTNAN